MNDVGDRGRAKIIENGGEERRRELKEEERRGYMGREEMESEEKTPRERMGKTNREEK